MAKKTVVAILILVALLMFNPGVDVHREALLPYVEKSLNLKIAVEVNGALARQPKLAG